jgi:murein DD-endopeptidase MepM/ murein hydrolase activator NlpD
MSAYGLTRDQSVELLVRTALEYGVTDRRQIAYILATAEHETDSFNTSREYDGPGQAIRKGYGGGENYYGRGYVQVTHDRNYDQMATTLGDPRIRTNPDIVAQEANLGAQTTVVGMARGLYTGVGLDRFINPQSADYTAARGVVNGTDSDAKIAGLARTWEQNLPDIIDRVTAQGITPRAMPGSPMADGSLSVNEKGPEVARMQEALRQRGFEVTPDGIYGNGTRGIVEQYQRQSGLPATGTADSATLTSLGVTQIVPLPNAATPTAPTAPPTSPQTPATPPTTEASQAAPQPSQPTPNDLAWPVPGQYKINESDRSDREGDGQFGSRRGETGSHAGIDIQGNIGDPIAAMKSGTVVYASNSMDPDGYGNSVLIDHGNGMATFYAHLSRIDVQPGQEVKAGEKIGALGADGNAAGLVASGSGDPHLHFEVIQGFDRSNLNSGRAVDPTPILAPVSQGQNQSQQTPTSTTPAQGGGVDDKLLVKEERGDGVKQLQEALNRAGIRDEQGQPLPVTGYFGDKTEAAVSKYQEQKGLEVDGKAGKDTLTALGIYPGQQQAPANTPPPTTETPQTPSNAAQTPPQTPSNVQPTDKPQTPPTTSDSPSTQPTQPTAPAPTNSTPTDKPHTPTTNDQVQPPTQTDKPLISSPNHPDNKLYQQAVSNLEQLGPSGGFRSREDLEKAAASVAADAKATGLNQIDHISKTSGPNGQSYLVAVQGDPTSPAAKNSYIDYNQATSQTVAQSTGMSEAQKPPAQQPAEQQEPNRVAMGAR